MPDECETPGVRELRTEFPAIAVAVHGAVGQRALRESAEKVQAEQAKKNTERTDSFSQLAECYLLRVVNLHTYGV